MLTTSCVSNTRRHRHTAAFAKYVPPGSWEAFRLISFSAATLLTANGLCSADADSEDDKAQYQLVACCPEDTLAVMSQAFVP